MEMLCKKQNEEWQKFQERLENEYRLQQEQMKNMMEANMETAKQDRELLVQENQDFQNKYLAFQKENENKLKEIGKMRDVLDKQNEEWCQQMELKAKAASDRQEEMEERHMREKEELRRQIEVNRETTFRELKAVSAKRQQEMEEKGKRDLDSLKSQYEEIDAKRLQELKDAQEKLHSIETQLLKAKEKSFLEFLWETKERAQNYCLIM